MDRVFTAIERAALPKQVVCSDFVAAPAKISDCEVSDRRLSFPKIMSGSLSGRRSVPAVRYDDSPPPPHFSFKIANLPEFGDGVLHRTIVRVQRMYFDPSDLDGRMPRVSK